MNLTRRHFNTLMAIGLTAQTGPRIAQAQAYENLAWEKMIPKDWQPDKSLAMLQKRMGFLPDGDPAVVALMEKMRKIWDNAPTVAALNGKKIRIAGFALPLDTTPGKVKSMLLVPYFGACVHTPPPPANQIILASSLKPLDVEMMSPVWLSGTLSTERSTTDSGISGYSLKIEKMEPYKD